MHVLTLLFLIALAIGTTVKLWLDLRQIRHVRARAEAVPDAFSERITLDDHRKAADYTVARTQLGFVDVTLDTLVLLGFTLGGGLQWLDTFWRGIGRGPILTGIAVILSVMLISAVISMPLSLYRTFGIEARFGFNRMTPALYVADLAKSLLISLALGLPLLAAILWIMQSAGDMWWLYAWLVWTAFMLLITWAWPAFIAPLFNKFSPLEDLSLRKRIENLLERCGFRSNGIFVMDGSRRSSHGNAYFTGLGNNKRIVFFDTLLEHLSGGEVEAVLAHELGHFKRKHIRKRLLLSFALSFAGLALLGWLVGQTWFYTALGVSQPPSHIALLLFMLVVPVFLFLLTPLSAWWSRMHEFEADEYAADQSDARDLMNALVTLYKDNATTLTPDPLHSGFYDSHPPAPVRIERLAGLAAR